MHIAVLDDNMVDRNQMNRLLTRVSDARKKKGLEGYFIDLYGSYDALMHNVAMYDAIFLDVVNETPKGHEIAYEIVFQGVHGKVVLMNSEITYKDHIEEIYLNDYLYINKPIKVPELEEVLSECEEARKHRKPKLELRSDTETFYINETELISASVREPGKITVSLSFEKELTILADMGIFKNDAEIFPNVVSINNTTLINLYHIESVNNFSVNMKNGENYKISPIISSKLKKKLKTIE